MITPNHHSLTEDQAKAVLAAQERHERKIHAIRNLAALRKPHKTQRRAEAEKSRYSRELQHIVGVDVGDLGELIRAARIIVYGVREINSVEAKWIARTVGMHPFKAGNTIDDRVFMTSGKRNPRAKNHEL